MDLTNSHTHNSDHSRFN